MTWDLYSDYFTSDDCDHPTQLRLVRALRWFDWVDAPAIYAALDVDGGRGSPTDRLQTALIRLWRNGIVDRREIERGPKWIKHDHAKFEYRLKERYRHAFVSRTRNLRVRSTELRDSGLVVSLPWLMGAHRVRNARPRAQPLLRPTTRERRRVSK